MSSSNFDARDAASTGITLGEPVILHDFPAHETELTAAHRDHLDEISGGIVDSFTQPLQVRRIVIVGHAATFRNISKAEYGRRALARAESAKAYLRSRLADHRRAKDVELVAEHCADDVPLVDNMVDSSSKTARRNRAINRRVEIHLDRRAVRPHHSVFGVGRAVEPEHITTEPEFSLPDMLFDMELGSCLQDTRRQVKDSTKVPFRWICAVEPVYIDPDTGGTLVTFGRRATGLLVSPRHVLTAAHVLRDEIEGSAGTIKVDDAVAVRVIPGINGPLNEFPFGCVSAQFRGIAGLRVKTRFRGEFYVSKQWRLTQDPAADIALIKLPLLEGTPLGQKRFNGQKLGWWGCPDFRRKTVTQPVAKKQLDGREVNVAGYPLDKQFEDDDGNLVRNADGRLVAVRFPQMISKGRCDFTAYSDWVDAFTVPENRKKALPYKGNDMLTYDACTLGGNSGSPVWVVDQKKRLSLVGVHSKGVRPEGGAKLPYEYGAGVRISRKMLQTLGHWQSQ